MDIIKAIQETATWIEKVNNDFTTNLFRTEKLSPHNYYYEIPNSEKRSAISQVVSTRSALLNEAGVELIPVADLHHYGRIMIFDPDSTTCDGAPEAESASYIDIGDAPPWDTWLAPGAELNRIKFYEPGHDIDATYLIAWVPKSHYFYANGAVEVACLDNFAWATNEFINNKYDSIKELFSKPVVAEPGSTLLHSDKTSKVSNVVLQELEGNSELHYKNAIAKYNSEKSFWSKLAIWKKGR